MATAKKSTSKKPGVASMPNQRINIMVWVFALLSVAFALLTFSKYL
jgi:hypothetical protein